MQLMRTMRQHILAGTWLDFYHAQRDVLDARDSYGPKTQHRSQADRKLAKMKKGRYEIVVRDEVGRIRDTVSGEVMHSVNDPTEEAHSLYVEQSRVMERLQAADAAPLVVWDVGLGAAANAMATIHAVESLPAAKLLPFVGIAVSVIAAVIALLYGAYATWNWAIADQIAELYEWKHLRPENDPIPRPRKLVLRPVLWFAKPRQGDLAPVFWIFAIVALLSAVVHLLLLFGVLD